MGSNQIGMGFASPEVESHTFNEWLGAWNSSSYKEGQILTTDGRTLNVKVRLSYPGQGLQAVINGEEYEIPCTKGQWIFKGDPVANVLSGIAIGITPRLFIQLEEEARIRHMAGSKQRKKEAREAQWEINRKIKAKELAGNA